MTKEEILEKSRNENKNQDVYDLDTQNKAARYSIFAASILCCLLIILQVVVKKILPFELIVILFGMESVLFITKYVKMRKNHELFVAIIYSLGFIISGVFYVKGLMA
ncbi:MAG: DUF6442 family protein [Treponema sp.]|nr:DUF6442 family protein [Treponema sp.]